MKIDFFQTVVFCALEKSLEEQTGLYYKVGVGTKYRSKHREISKWIIKEYIFHWSGLNITININHHQDCRAVPFRLGQDSVYSSDQLWRDSSAVLGIVWPAIDRRLLWILKKLSTTTFACKMIEDVRKMVLKRKINKWKTLSNFGYLVFPFCIEHLRWSWFEISFIMLPFILIAFTSECQCFCAV